MKYSAEYHRVALQRSRQRRRSAGRCMQCQKPTVGRLRVCEDHRTANMERHRQVATKRYTEADRRAKTMLTSARQRAARDGVQCTITWEWILGCLTAGACAVTGLPFDLSRHPVFKTNPFAPSIDRINAGSDYSPANCRVVLLAVNAAMNEWGEDVFQQVASAYLQRHPIAK